MSESIDALPVQGRFVSWVSWFVDLYANFCDTLALLQPIHFYTDSNRRKVSVIKHGRERNGLFLKFGKGFCFCGAYYSALVIFLLLWTRIEGVSLFFNTFILHFN